MVRDANIDDIKSINKLGKLINELYEELFNLEEILKEEHSRVYVFEKDNKVVAFLHVTELYETVDIIDIVVEEKYRKQNIATLMIDYMIGDVNPSVELFTLEVAVDNLNAISLYEKFGFEIINTRKSYYSGSDAYLMAKRVGD